MESECVCCSRPAMKQARTPHVGASVHPGTAAIGAWRAPQSQPMVGITPDVIDRNGLETSRVTNAYAEAVFRAGGVPLVLSPIPELLPEYLRRVDAFVLTGGDDPRTEPFGVPTHPAATPLHPKRQAFESALISALATTRPEIPVLGVCLGMQLLALHAGGTLDQHMPDTRSDAARHWDADHPVVPVGSGSHITLPPGIVRSKHKQAVSDPGRLRVVALSDDGVIEAVTEPSRRFALGVQWHPERTPDAALGLDLFKRLIAAARV